MKNHKTYIISNCNFMADFIFDEFKNEENYVHIKYKEKKNILTTVLKWIRLHTGNRRGLFNCILFYPDFIYEIKNIKENDRVILWSIENLKVSLLIVKEIKSKHIESFLWNPMFRLRNNKKYAKKYIHDLKKINVKLSTFDRDDSNLLNCKLMPQVHRAINISTSNQMTYDVFFVGQLKGREHVLSNLSDYFIKHKISFYFHLVFDHNYDNKAVPENLKQYVTKKLMDYNKTLLNIASSECLLDLSQNGQRGLTLRPIEALLYDKKLITNNISIKAEPFYNKNNIWIIGDKEEKRSILEFLKATPSHHIDEEIKQLYQIRYWLNNL